MGSSLPKSYKEQKNAIEKGDISFGLNIYFVGEGIDFLYNELKKFTKDENGNIFSYWNYYYTEGPYKTQLEQVEIEFLKIQEKYENDLNTPFKEVLIFYFNKREKEKIEQILEIFGEKEDLYCPFIIFLFEEDNPLEKEIEEIIPDKNNSNISPLKVFTIQFDKREYFSFYKLYRKLFRICSYYNELGDQFFIWTKDSEFPIEYNLIEGEFNSYINIICLGRTGCGKSTFLNKFFNEKRCKEGGNNDSTTSKVNRFGIDNVPIRIYDIPGFEDKDTIQLVAEKLTEKANELNNDRDTIHIILYFINYGSPTFFYDMEKNIIDILKTNNKDVKIIFILTHSPNDPYEIEIGKPKKKKSKIKDQVGVNEKLLLGKIDTLVSNISSLFGNYYSYESKYFKKGEIKQDNIIFANLVAKDELNIKIKEFGYDKIIKSIAVSISSDVEKEELSNLLLEIKSILLNRVKDKNQIDERITNTIKESYFLRNSTFFLEKDKAIEEATALYNSMFTYGKIFSSFFPIIKDFKMGINKYQKYKFKKELKRIFGFAIKNESFKNANNDYVQMMKNFAKEKDAQKANQEKNNVVQEIRDNYHKTEVNTGLIFANEAVGLASYALLSNPITFVFGGLGLIGSSYISYNQFKKDCTEYFEQYRDHYEEYKYRSLCDCIESLILGIDYFQKLKII